MRLPRYSTLQFLLAATLVALLLGLVTSAWRASKYQSIEQVCFSPNGQHLAARYSGGGVVVWRLDKSDPRLIARAFGHPELFNFNLNSIHFVTDDKLLYVETQWASSNPGTQVRQLDLKTRQVTDQVRIDSQPMLASAQAATAERLLLSDWNGNGISSFGLKTGRLERSWTLPGPAVWRMAISPNGTTTAVCDQSRQAYLIEVESDRAPITIQGGEPLAVSGDGRIVVTTSMNKAATVHLYDTPDSTPVELEFKLATVKALVITPDNSRLLVTDGRRVEYYDLTKQGRLPRVEVDHESLQLIDSCVFSPVGNRLATHNGTEIVVYDLPSGNARYISAGGPRLLEIVIFTLGFALWSATWGIVSKRERLKSLSLAPVLPPALTPSTNRPVPAVVPWNRQLVWVIVMIGCSFAMVAVLDIRAYSSIATDLVQMATTLATMVAGVTLVAVVFAWIRFFIKGPHQLTLIRLQRLAGASGRLHRVGRLTFWFVGKLRLETDYEKHLDDTLTHAEDLFGRCVEPKHFRLTACLDRQCDVDAFFGRHIPVPAIIPRYWTARLAIVCEETAAMQLMLPQRALRSALAFSIIIEQKRGFLPGWVGTLLSQQIARDERRPAELRAAIRRLNVLFVRQPNWDPRQVFVRSARERLKLWLAHDDRQSWIEMHAETDLLLTLGEMLLGPDTLPERRQRVLAWLRAIRPKDDPLSTFTRDVGLTLDALLDEWRQWLASQSGLPYDPMPVNSRWLLRDVALPTLANRQLPVKLRQQMVRQLGVFYVAGAPALMELLSDPKLELRREAAEALERLSGQTWGDDLARWQDWWQSIPLPVRSANAGDALSRMVSAVVVNETVEAAATACATNSSSAPPVFPQELTLCWTLMLAGGLIALLIPIALLFAIGPAYYPMVYYSLFAGVAGIVRGAARDTIGLSRVAGLQMMNVMVCDPVNLIAGWIEHRLLRRPHVQQYLLAVNGGHL